MYRAYVIYIAVTDAKYTNWEKSSRAVVGYVCRLLNFMYIFKVLFVCVKMYTSLVIVQISLFVWQLRLLTCGQGLMERSCTKWLLDPILCLECANCQKKERKTALKKVLVLSQKTHSLHWELTGSKGGGGLKHKVLILHEGEQKKKNPYYSC